MENLVILGGSGFVGKNLVDAFHRRYRVSVCARDIDRAFFERYPDVRTVRHHFPDPRGTARIVQELEPNIVINLVSVVTTRRDNRLFDELIRTNLDVLLELFESLRSNCGLKVFLQFGSAEEYGPIQAPFREDERELPNSPYGLVKQMTTNTALMLHRVHDFPAIAVRPGVIFGPYQEEARLIPHIIGTLRAGRPLQLTPGMQTRDFIHVRDLAEALDCLIGSADRAKGQVVNVSYGEAVQLRAIVEYVRSCLQSESAVDYGALPYRPDEIMDFQCDISRIRAVAGWVPKRTFFQALDEMLESGGGDGE